MKNLSEEERTYALGMARKYFSDDPGFTSWHDSQFADPIRREIVAKIEALKALVGEMAKDNGQVAYEGDRCNFCGEHEPDHTPDCPVTRAQDLGVLPKEGG